MSSPLGKIKDLFRYEGRKQRSSTAALQNQPLLQPPRAPPSWMYKARLFWTEGAVCKNVISDLDSRWMMGNVFFFFNVDHNFQTCLEA